MIPRELAGDPRTAAGFPGSAVCYDLLKGSVMAASGSLAVRDGSHALAFHQPRNSILSRFPSVQNDMRTISGMSRVDLESVF